MKFPIRVLIVDDSPVVRTVLASMLKSAPGIEVVGEAQDGVEAVALTQRLRPDAITMDIRMPALNGLEATKQIMASTPTPILVVASSIYEADLNIAFNAVAAGALTVVEKPKGLLGDDYDAVRDQLVSAVRLVADLPVVPVWTAQGAPDAAAARNVQLDGRPVELVGIGASTGGPSALRVILRGLGPSLQVPIVVVQHITPGFVRGFAHWLDGQTELPVQVAEDGVQLAPGQVYVAPDDAHLTILRGGQVRLDAGDPVQGRRPSATRLLQSVAQSYGASAVGVLLSGMGEDGVEGLEALHRAGGHIIVQTEESCVVPALPLAALARGIADQTLSPEEIGITLRHLDGVRRVD